jgi:hypothetical protein
VKDVEYAYNWLTGRAFHCPWMHNESERNTDCM